MEDNKTPKPNFINLESVKSPDTNTVENNSESSKDEPRGREQLKTFDGANHIAQYPDPRRRYWGVSDYSYTYGKLYTVPRKIFYMTNLRILDLSNNSLATMPAELRRLPFLQVLNLSHNDLSTLPNPFIETPWLKSLNISHNKFTQVPTALYKSVPCVRVLDMSNNFIDKFVKPPLCANYLQMLDLGSNKLTHIPRWIFDLKFLKILDLNNNSLSDVPSNFLHEQPVVHFSRSIKVLNLQNCRITSKEINFVSSILDLEALILSNTFDVRPKFKNSFPVLSAFIISRAMSLKYLIASNIDMFFLHNNIYSLRNIQYLDLSYNALMWLPDSFCDLISLTECKLNSNFLHYLPDNIGKLFNLKKIVLTDNNLVELPKSFKLLSNLEICDLYDNMLETIDIDIIKLKSLKGIDLGDNCLVLDQMFDENFVEILDIYWSLKESYRNEMGFERLDVQDQAKLKNGMKERKPIKSPDFIANYPAEIYNLRLETPLPNWNDNPTIRFGHYEEGSNVETPEETCRRPADNSCNCKTCHFIRLTRKRYFMMKLRENEFTDGQYDSDSD